MKKTGMGNVLKINIFDGHGLSSVMEREGDYILSPNKNSSAAADQNFFDDLKAENAKVRRYDRVRPYQSIDAFKEDLEKNNTLTVRISSGEDSSLVMFSRIDCADWLFVTKVEEAVLDSQSNRLMSVFSAVSAVLAATFVLVILLLYRSRQAAARQLAEAKHKAELTDALALAQQANRAKTVFLNSMSHDIRTPMNAIIGFTALAAKHIDNRATVEDYLGKIRQSGEHLMSLINDILDMSRIESGKMNLNETEENLSEIFKSLRNIVQADVAAKRLELCIDAVNVTDEHIICDKLRLNQVLLNLLSNAIKYTQPGGTISLRILETRKADETGRARFEFRVKDNGIGMSPEYVKTVFEPFTRERTSTVSGIQGTGLGMAITKNIADMMNGTITVESELNKGSEFVVTLDLQVYSVREETENIECLRNFRSIVVDDDMNTCQSVSQMLRQIGMRSEWCMYGREAIAKTEEAIRIGDRFRVYIIDWLMPDLNGIETARRIRQIVGDDAPIIIVTAYDYADIEEEGRAAGVSAFVSKPLFSSDLRRTLSELCGISGEEETEEVCRFDGKRVLLVEDNELNREIAVEILEEAGLVIDTAEDGSIAVEKMKYTRPGDYDLVLMDIQMPIMDGYEATCAIRSLPEAYQAEIPILAMTANAFEEDKKKALEAGMNEHIAKPIDIPRLFETLREVLG